MDTEATTEESAMDELIRDLEKMRDDAVASQNHYEEGSTLSGLYAAQAHAYRNAVTLAYAAKRRMTEREPAWDVR
jgi:hypothetical protein